MALKKAFVVLGTAGVALLLSAGTANAQGMADQAMAKRGRTLWQNRGCAGCHAVGRKMIAPDLAGLTQRRTKEWIVRWLKDPGAMLETDSIAMAMKQEYNGAVMPTQKLSDQDIEALLAYVAGQEAKLRK